MVNADDVNYHYPYALHKNFRLNLDNAVELVKEGLPPADACVTVYGISRNRFFVWCREAEEDMENGVVQSPLITVLTELAKADSNLHRKLAKTANKIAVEDENVEMIKFLLERRYGYKKQSQQEVEVSTPEDLSFNINITNSEDNKG